MTVEEIKECGIPIDDISDTTLLVVESALEYVLANTRLKFDPADTDSIKALPSCVKLFVLKYNELITSGTEGIASESLGGMSQSFDTTDKSTLLYSLLQSLLGEYITPQIQGIPRVSRYRYGN